MNIARALPAAREDFEAASAYVARWRSPAGAEAAGSEAAAMPLAKLAAAWEDAAADVPYYRDLVSAGRAPRRIATWDDLRAIPVLDRATFRDNQASFLRTSGPPHQYLQTAGSTGNPMRFGVWGDEGRPQRIAKQAAWIRGGYRLGSDLVLVWGHSHLLGTGMRGWVNHAKRRAKDWCLGYHRANAYTLGRDDCLAIARRIVRTRPVGVIGYAAALDLIARHAHELGDDLRGAGVRFVISTAEPPPREDSLDRIRDAFGGCTMIEEFGGVEFGQLATRFDRGEWEIFPDLNILEAPEEGVESEGHALVVTTLYRRYTPFFRYRQGDLVRGPRRLAHGALAGFEGLVGRAGDMVAMADGRSVHSVAFLHCVHQEPAVLNIQMVLADAGPRLKLVLAGAPDPQLEARIRGRLGQVHPSLRDAPIDYTQDLATNAAGKRRWFLDQRTRAPAGD